jgi:hypothetical protein
MTRRRHVLGAAVIGAILAVLFLWVRYGEFWQIDGCLDSGGAWNYASKKCGH